MIRRLKRPALIGAGLLLFTFLTVDGLERFWPRTTADAPQTDAIICLGAGVVATSGNLGSRSKARVKTCVDLYLAGKAPILAFTGAASDSPKGDVATQMAAYARDRGVPISAIVVEPDAESTLQNALFTLPKLDNPASVLLVSDAFHLPRSWMSFKLIGAPHVRLQATATRAPLSWKTRETLAIWFNLLRYPVYLAAKSLGVSSAASILH